MKKIIKKVEKHSDQTFDSSITDFDEQVYARKLYEEKIAKRQERINNADMNELSDKIRYDLQMYPHIPDPRTEHDPRFDLKQYVSIQSRVNADPKFEEMYVNKMISDGWVALKNVEDLFLFPRGRTFKYRLNGDSLSGAPEGTFRSGGWFLGKNADDPQNNHKYILYKAYNGAIFSLQIKDILEIYVKSKSKEISVFKKPASVTKFPVYLPDPNTGVPQAIYYGKDEFQRKRFMSSQKYKRAKEMGIWSWSVVFNDEFEPGK